MKKALYILCDYLMKNALEEDAESIRRLEEDWDVEEEERQLSPSPHDIDKMVRETNPRKGWHLPDEDISSSRDFSWINNDIIENQAGRRHLDLDTITSEFVSALNVASDGSQPKFVGAGAWGVVWDIGNDKYLKIYNLAVDQPTVDLTRRLIFEKVPFAEHELMVLSSGKFSDPKDPVEIDLEAATLTAQTRKGWKIMEKLLNIKDLGKLDPDLVLDFSSFVGTVREIIYDIRRQDGPAPEMMTELRNKARDYKVGPEPDLIFKTLSDPKSTDMIDAISEFLLKEVMSFSYRFNKGGGTSFGGRMTEAFNLDKDWMIKLIKHMVVLNITGRLDTHMGNIGLRPSTGTFIFFDA